ncbi:MAG: hypothetical protein H0U95_04030 [Bacteroidetes bacterium]|nr:hypothetical protein [Bacteroidota bacterium]
MKNFKQISLIIITAFSLYTCTAFKKNIDKPVVVAMPDQTVPVIVNSTAMNTKYSNTFSNQQLGEHFLKGFESEAKITKNVTLKNDAVMPDFIVKVKSITITESSQIQKVNDPKSPYNGQDMVLNTVDCRAELEITDTKSGAQKLSNCTNSKSRSEQLKNNRNLDDLISGTNKDHTSYHTKLLSDSICLNLSQDVGRRIWVPITRRISKEEK